MTKTHITAKHNLEHWELKKQGKLYYLRSNPKIVVLCTDDQEEDSPEFYALLFDDDGFFLAKAIASHYALFEGEILITQEF